MEPIVPSTAARFSRLQKALRFMVFPLCIWAPNAHADVFISIFENKRVALMCEGPKFTDTACSLSTG
jgi:hypothetical protein